LHQYMTLKGKINIVRKYFAFKHFTQIIFSTQRIKFNLPINN
jgi:hypothetical protein